MNHNLNHQTTESPISEQSRCSSNTSYSSDSALSKCSKHTQTKSQTDKLIENEKILKPKQLMYQDYAQKNKNFAFSVNDLRGEDEEESYISSIRNNQIFKDYERKHNLLMNKIDQMPKPRNRKSKFDLKYKTKLNGMYKSLPNVNSLENNRFGQLDLNVDEEDLIRSDKSTSSEQSVSTIKSNNKTNSSNKLSESSNDDKLNKLIQENFFSLNKSNQQDFYNFDTSLIAENKIDSNFISAKHPHIYENLPFQKTVNDLLATNLSSNQNMTPSTNSFQPAPNLITTTPNRIGTKIGISSLNRHNNKLNSAQKNQNLKLNLLNNSLDKPSLRTSCSYQLLDNKNLSTINDQNHSTAFKTTRASSDPGVLTYSSTGDLVKVSSKDSVVFYQNPITTDSLKLSNSLNRPSITSPQSTSLNANSFDNYQSISNSIFYSSLNTINDDNVMDNFGFEKQLNNQINQQKKILNRKNQNFPLRLAESEMNLISNSDQRSIDSYNIYPPPYEYSDKAAKLEKQMGKFKATSEQQLNRVEPNKFMNKLNQKLNLNERQLDSIDSLEKLKERTHDLDLPLISQLFQDRSLMMLPKTVPNCSRETHQKPKRYSLENRNTIDLKLVNQKISSEIQTRPCQQTNLDESLNRFNETNLDSCLIENLNYPKYDKNFNLESNNLNKLQLEHKMLNLRNNVEIVDKIWKK